MVYVKQLWVDDDGSGTTGSPFDAERMNHIEDGIEGAAVVGPPGPPGGAPAQYVQSSVATAIDPALGFVQIADLTLVAPAAASYNIQAVLDIEVEGANGQFSAYLFVNGAQQVALPFVAHDRTNAGATLDTRTTVAQQWTLALAAGDTVSIKADAATLWANCSKSCNLMMYTAGAGPKGDKGDQGDQGPAGNNDVIPMDIWHVVGAVGEPAFGANVIAVSLTDVESEPTQATPAFRKFPNGVVQLRGAVRLTAGATGAVVFTLPVGYRPPAPVVVDSGNGTGGTTVQIKILANGRILIPGAIANYLLDGLVFDTETVVNMPSGPKGDKGDKGDPGSGAGHVIQDESVTLTQRAKLNFKGAGVVVTDDAANDASVVTVTPLAAVAMRGNGSGASLTNVAGAWKNVPFGAAGLTEPSDAFTVVGGAIVVKDAGWYRISAGVICSSSTNNNLYVALSTSATPGDGDIANGTAHEAFVRTVVTGNAKMPAGGIIYLHANSGNASPVDVYCQQFAIERIGGPQGPVGPTGGNATVPMDAWHVVAGEFAAAWGSYIQVAYKKDPLGKVQIRGVARNTVAFVNAAANATIMTLPVGYRPAQDWDFKAICTNPDGSTNSLEQVRVYAATGNVTLVGVVSGAPTGGIGSYARLDEILFDTDTVTQMPTGPQGPAGPAAGVNVQDEGSLLTVRSKLNIIGTNIRAVDDPANDRINIIGEIPLVTALTAGAQGIPNPIPNGFMADLLMTAPDTTIAMWRFRYRSTSPSAYKWECISGVDIHSYGGNLPCASTSAYIDLSVVQNFICPIEAEYLFRWGCQTYNTVGAANHFMALWNATANAVAAELVTFAPAINTQVAMSTELKVGLAIGTDIRTRYHTSGGSGQFLGRYLAMRPVRAP